MRCSWAGDGPLVGSASNGQLFIFDRHQRQVTHTIQLRSLGTPLAGVPEAHGVVHLTAACTRNTPLLHAAKCAASHGVSAACKTADGDVYGVTQSDVFKLDVSTLRVQYLDAPPIRDLYQIIEGPQPGVFFIGARGHLLEYHVSTATVCRRAAV